MNQLKKEEDSIGAFLALFKIAGCTSNYASAPSIARNLGGRERSIIWFQGRVRRYFGHNSRGFYEII